MYISAAIASVALAFSGGLLLVSILTLVNTKRSKSIVLKAEDYKNYLKRKVLPLMWIEVFVYSLLTLFFVVVYSGFLR
ncbi:MAG: hypothetical protein AB1333_02925 [Patescibacteria group bacterium]